MTLARVRMNALDTEVSALGFGCASLGSRVAPSAGLAALERAYDAGVTWYDVAPSYGDGQAEVLLGRFLANHDRRSVQVLTKVGIAPPQPSPAARMIRPIMRAAVAAVPGLRSVVRRRRPGATKLPLEAALIERSLDASLRRLGTDYVDVLALHDATPEEATRDDVRHALEAAVESGKARTVAIASSPEANATGVTASSLYGLVQMGNSLLDPGLAQFRSIARRHVDVVTHSVFGNDGAIAQLAARIKHDPPLYNRITETGYDGEPSTIAADMLADFAFSDNSEGVIIVSMFTERHLRHNLTRHALSPDPATIRMLAARLGYNRT